MKTKPQRPIRAAQVVAVAGALLGFTCQLLALLTGSRLWFAGVALGWTVFAGAIIYVVVTRSRKTG